MAQFLKKECILKKEGGLKKGRQDTLLSSEKLCRGKLVQSWCNCDCLVLPSFFRIFFFLQKLALREESNAKKSPGEQKNAELKNANLVQNSHSFILHFLNHSHQSHSLILQFSGILDHSQSFIQPFLNSRLHFLQCIFVRFKEIWHSLCKATLGNEANRKWKKKKKKHLAFFSQS